MVKLIWQMAASLRLSIWLLGIQVALFLAGALMMPTMKEYGTINSIALFEWMRTTPLAATWWMWASVAVVALLGINTLACSIEAVARRSGGRSALMVLSPQIIHAGFLLLMVAHLASAAGAASGRVAMAEGESVDLWGRELLVLDKVEMTLAPSGMPVDYGARLSYRSQSGELLASAYTAPNRPSLRGGLGVYIKDIRPGMALIEVHREPGRWWALAGGSLFLLGTLMLMAHKVARER